MKAKDPASKIVPQLKRTYNFMVLDMYMKMVLKLFTALKKIHKLKT